MTPDRTVVPTWNREQMAEAARLAKFLTERLDAGRVRDAVQRLREILGSGFGGGELEQVGYAWQSRVTGVWSFRHGTQPEPGPGPQSPPRHDVFIVRGGQGRD